jgi:hypothetical protein
LLANREREREEEGERNAEKEETKREKFSLSVSLSVHVARCFRSTLTFVLRVLRLAAARSLFDYEINQPDLVQH